MSSDADDTDPWRSPLPGFQRRADTDAPVSRPAHGGEREAAAAPAVDREFGPRPSARDAAPAERRPGAWMAAVGLAGLALGVGIGAALTRVNGHGAYAAQVAQAVPAPASPATARATEASVASEAPAATLPVELVPPPPPPLPPPRRGDRLEVLPPTTPAQRVAVATPSPRLTPPAFVAPAPAAPVAPAADASASVAASPVQRPAPRPPAGSGPERAAPPADVRLAEGPCPATLSPAQRMVCEDRGLAAADRRMRRAYAGALDAGVPREDLEADQADWRRIREDAARYSRRAVANVYSQRIEELEDLAAGR